PSLNTIAEKASCSRDRTIKSIKNLKKAGYINVEKRKDERKGYKSNLYKIVDLGYINDIKNLVKEKLGNENLLKKINERLQKHPLPEYDELITLVYENDKGGLSERQGGVAENDKASLSERPELELRNYNKTEEEERTREKKIPDKIKNKFNQIFNRELSAEFYKKMTKKYSDQKIIRKALEVAEANADKPSYLLKLLSDWQNNGLTSISSINTYLEERKAQKGSQGPKNKSANSQKQSMEELYDSGYR
ncbi:MAG: helix-turn-helix domain-containing protein, partial [Halanaerobiales bacterium]